MNIAEMLLQSVVGRGDQDAVVDVHMGRERRVSFRELDRLSASVAGQFRSAGLKPGDGVLLLHPVATELYVVLIALFRLGCVAIFPDLSAGRAQIERCCRLLPPKALFGSRKANLFRWTVPALRRVPLAFCPGRFPGAQPLEFTQVENPDHEIALAADATPALVTFTSGSTGEPKAALRTHGFLLAQHRAIEQTLASRRGTRDLTTLPVFVLANLASGVTSILPDADLRFPGRIDPRPVLAQIRRHRIETVAASPAFMARILDECARTNTSIPELSQIYLGGAPVFPRILRKTKQLCPRAKITAVYGSTEAEPMAEISLTEVSDADMRQIAQGKGLLAGRPVPSMSLRIVSDQWGTPIQRMSRQHFEQITLRAQQPGEIVVAGDHVLPGYLHAAGDAETKFEVEGTRWHRTGDLGYLDGEGRLWLLGRCSAKISGDRGMLYPFAVECAAMENPSVRCAALTSLDGRRVLALEAEKAISMEELSQSLAGVQIDEVVLVKRIPVDKRHNAKVDYPALADQLKRAAIPACTVKLKIGNRLPNREMRPAPAVPVAHSAANRCPRPDPEAARRWEAPFVPSGR